MAPNYKFTYFNLKGLGEPARFLFQYGNIKFEEVRVQIPDWAEVKPTIFYGQLPLLEVDGKIFNQSTSICRYLAKQVKLDGADDLENLEIDSILDTFIDLKTKLNVWSKEPADIKEEKRSGICADVDFYFSKFDEVIKNNNGHLACGKLTWADIYVAAAMDYIIFLITEDVTGKYPQLKKMLDHVYNIPAIKEWIAERPVTIF